MTKVLVSYASEHGGTAEIAKTIAKVLRQFNLDVTAKRIESVESIADYDAIIFGTAIYVGDWLPKARRFLEEHQSELAHLPLWLFSSGPTGTDDPVKLLNNQLVPPNLELLIQSLHPRDIRVFHGRIDLRRLPPKDREMLKAAAIPSGDYRDWAAIKLWANEISRSLLLNKQALGERIP